jgi:hypothetical protein
MICPILYALYACLSHPISSDEYPMLRAYFVLTKPFQEIGSNQNAIHRQLQLHFRAPQRRTPCLLKAGQHISCGLAQILLNQTGICQILYPIPCMQAYSLYNFPRVPHLSQVPQLSVRDPAPPPRLLPILQFSPSIPDSRLSSALPHPRRRWRPSLCNLHTHRYPFQCPHTDLGAPHYRRERPCP